MKRRNTINALHDSWPMCPYYYTFNNGSYDDVFLFQHDIRTHRQLRRPSLLSRRRVRSQISGNNSCLWSSKRKRNSRINPEPHQTDCDMQQHSFRKCKRIHLSQQFCNSLSSAVSAKEQVDNSACEIHSESSSIYDETHNNTTQDRQLTLQLNNEQFDNKLQYYKHYFSLPHSRREKRQTLANVISCLSRNNSITTNVSSNSRVLPIAINHSLSQQLLPDEELQTKWESIRQYKHLKPSLPILDNEKTLQQSNSQTDPSFEISEYSHNKRASSSYSHLLTTYTSTHNPYDNNSNGNTQHASVWLLSNSDHEGHVPTNMLEVNSSPTATNTLTTTLHGNDSSRASHQSSRNISEFTAVTANKGQLPYKTDTKEQSRYSHASEKSREYQFHSDHPITLDSNSDENPDDILMFPIDDASTNNTSNIPFQSSSSSTTTSSTSSHTSSLPPRISNYPQKMISTASFQTSLENRHITIVDPTTTVTVQHSNHHELSVTAVTAIPTGEKFLHLEEIAMVDLFQRKTARVDMLLLLFGFLFFPLWWYGSWRFFMHTEYKQKTAAKHLQLINCFMSLVSLLLLGLMIGLVTVWA